MKKLLYISAAALLSAAAACNPLTVDPAYDLEALDPTVTVLPGITIDATSLLKDPVTFEIGKLLGEAAGDDSFLKSAPADDPFFQEGDLFFRQDAVASDISPVVEDIFENADPSKATIENAMAVYMVDVPGMLNISNLYNLSNPCFKLQIASDEAFKMSMDITLRISGALHNINNVPLQALTSQTVYISALGGYAKDASESDFLAAELAELVSPLPFEIRIMSIRFHTHPDGAPAYTPAMPVNISLLPSFILPAAFAAPSSFGTSLAFSGVSITPKSGEIKVGLSSISARFSAVNTAPVEFQIKGQPNDSVSISVPPIMPGSLDSPVTTTGDIVLSYKSYTSISSLVTDITASVKSGLTSAQLNSKQGVSLTLQSVTVPDGVEIEFLK